MLILSILPKIKNSIYSNHKNSQAMVALFTTLLIINLIYMI